MLKTTQNSKLKTNHYSVHSGFVLLIVLVAVAIMMVLYFLDFSVIFGPGIKTKSGAAESRPWLEENLIAEPDKLIELPKRPKPALDEDFSLTAQVTRDDDKRGEVIIDFADNGQVSGSWQCQYSHDKRNDSFEAAFAGNIVADKSYSDEKTNDPSKLYFITKGNYIQTIYNPAKNRQSSTEGTIYVTGWLNPDYSAFGLITITTDKKWSAVYNWQSVK